MGLSIGFSMFFEMTGFGELLCQFFLMIGLLVSFVFEWVSMGLLGFLGFSKVLLWGDSLYLWLDLNRPSRDSYVF